jgi:hypothetical protein
MASHPADSNAAKINASIASKPTARWFGNDADIGTAVVSYPAPGRGSHPGRRVRS